MIPSEPKHHDLVARRAYEIWQAQGRPHGMDKEHWLMAERELSAPAPAPKRARKAAANGAAPARKSSNGKAKKPKA